MENNKEFGEKMRKRIYQLVNDILAVSKTIDWKNLYLGDARDQLARACTSIGANYIEAIGASSAREFARFLSHSMRSANETQYWLLLIANLLGNNNPRFMAVVDETRQISKILGASVNTIRKTRPIIKKL